ncbi:Carboxylesterase 2 [Acaryochloris thomasi RCC1774]|uniref:Carboxylesterase 2 n=2 Tax=Acaryochloris TaxID=155977 RepID=A0A2W1JZK3_9CYAN|nr:Carboxylesterase 2 [Acaryochloris thomasi RCC1774]
MLHGWGSNAEDMAAFAPTLDLPNYRYLFPNGPFPHPQTPGGWMWYDLSTQDPDGLAHSRKLLLDWIQSLPEKTGIPLSQTILGGFSQGGAMTLEVGLGLPVAGLIVLSGYLHGLDPEQDSQSCPPTLIIHGRQDEVVPLAAAQMTRETLAASQVDYHEFDMGHEVIPEALGTMQQFIRTL